MNKKLITEELRNFKFIGDNRWSVPVKIVNEKNINGVMTTEEEFEKALSELKAPLPIVIGYDGDYSNLAIPVNHLIGSVEGWARRNNWYDVIFELKEEYPAVKIFKNLFESKTSLEANLCSFADLNEETMEAQNIKLIFLNIILVDGAKN
jgi:hypothetical protein